MFISAQHRPNSPVSALHAATYAQLGVNFGGQDLLRSCHQRSPSCAKLDMTWTYSAYSVASTWGWFGPNFSLGPTWCMAYLGAAWAQLWANMDQYCQLNVACWKHLCLTTTISNVFGLRWGVVLGAYSAHCAGVGPMHLGGSCPTPTCRTQLPPSPRIPTYHSSTSKSRPWPAQFPF